MCVTSTPLGFSHVPLRSDHVWVYTGGTIKPGAPCASGIRRGRCVSPTRSPTDSDRAQHVFLFCTRSGCSLVTLVAFHLCSFQRQTLIETWGFGEWGVFGWPCSQGDEQCVRSQLAPSKSAKSPLSPPPGWLIKPTLEADFPHCQQMPAHICINTLHLKRQPDWNATMLQYPGNGKLGAAPINGSWILAHQKH